MSESVNRRFPVTPGWLIELNVGGFFFFCARAWPRNFRLPWPRGVRWIFTAKGSTTMGEHSTNIPYTSQT